jgi:hypothetical protein
MQEFVTGTAKQPDSDHEQDFKRLERLLDNVNTTHCIYDITQGRFVFVSRSVSELLEMERSRVLKEWPSIMNTLVPLEYHGPWESALRDWFVPYLTGFLQGNVLQMLCYEFPIRLENGKLLWLLQQVVPLAWNTDNVLTLCAFLISDMTANAAPNQQFESYTKPFTTIS